jgi:hypothetical protein
MVHAAAARQLVLRVMAVGRIYIRFSANLLPKHLIIPPATTVARLITRTNRGRLPLIAQLIMRQEINVHLYS